MSGPHIPTLPTDSGSRLITNEDGKQTDGQGSPHQPTAEPVHKPTLLQLALAVSLVRSRPEGMSTRDYILGIREHIRPGSSDNGCIDLASFWRLQYELTFKNTQAIIDYLWLREDDGKTSAMEKQVSKENRQAASQQPMEPLNGEDLVACFYQRNVAYASLVEAEKSPALAQIGQANAFECSPSPSCSEPESDPESALAAVAFELSHMIKSSKYRLQVIIEALVRCLRLMTEIVTPISSTATDRVEALPNGRKHVGGIRYSLRPRTLSLFHQILLILLQTLMVLDVMGPDQVSLEYIFSEFSTLFRCIYRAMNHLSTLTPQAEGLIPGIAPTEPPLKNKSVSNGAALLLSHFLKSFASSLDLTNSIHLHVFDLFSSILVQNLGSKLFLSVFLVNPTRPDRHNRLKSGLPAQEINIKGTPHLISILSSVVDASSKVKSITPTGNHESVKAKSWFASTANTRHSYMRFKDLHRRKMQSQLVMAIEHAAEEADEKASGIWLSTKEWSCSDDASSFRLSKWFIENLWQYIGWDSMSSENEWNT